MIVTSIDAYLGVSNSNRDSTHLANLSDLAQESADPMLVMVGSGSPPPEPENYESVGGFSPQNLKKPDQTEI